MTKLIARRKDNALVTEDEDARKALSSIPNGAEVTIDVKLPRNLKQLKLFWSLVGMLVDNTDVYDTKEKAKQGLCLATGHVDMLLDHTGHMHLIPKSIAFDNMEQDDFNTLFEDGVKLVARLLETAPDVIRQRAYDMIDGKGR